MVFSFECFKNTLLFLCVCVFILVVLQEGLITAYTRKMVPIKKRASSFPIIVCHPALPSFHLRLLVVSFCLDERTISGVDLIKMPLKGTA